VVSQKGESFKFLANFTDEFFVSVQAEAISILLSSHELWQHQAGFIVVLESSGRKSLIKRCSAVDDEPDKNCKTRSDVVSPLTRIF